jgi:putative ABC transport system permease protein
MRSLMRLQAVDPGFDTAQVLALQLTVPAHRYGPYEVGGANARRAALYRELARRVSEVPGAEAAAVTGLLPLRHGVNPWGVSIEGRGAPSVTERGGAATRLREGLFHHGSVSIERVTPGYFRTLSIRLVSGRLIDDRDAAGSVPVTVVNETFVRQFFPGEDPIGRRLTADMTSYFPKLTIVGVVADNKMHGLDRDPYPLLFWSMDQFPSANAWLVARTAGAPDTLARSLRTAVGRVDSDLAINEVASMDAVVAGSIWRQRFATFLIGVFAALALLLAAAGIYAVMSYSVTQRIREIGLRITLGALPREILSLVIGRGVRLAVAGVLVGTAASLVLRRLLSGYLFGVSASDPLTMAAVSGVMLAVAVIACLVPAVRALRVDPIAALRSE